MVIDRFLSSGIVLVSIVGEMSVAAIVTAAVAQQP